MSASGEVVQNTGLYVLLVVYLLVLAAIALVAYARKRRAAATSGHLEAHFGGSFSPPVLILTTFSTVYSGFTVTGIPQDANKNGFLSLRWIAATIVIVGGMLLYFPRLRRLAVMRGYRSPNDFITDRYRSQVLRLLCAICATLPMLLYLSAQMVSFASMLSGVTYGGVSKFAAMVIFGVIVLAMEFLGGMHSVVLTDAVQSLIMIVAFIITPFVLAAHYGWLWEIAPSDCSALAYYAPLNATSADSVPPVCPLEEQLMQAGAPCDASGCLCAGCLGHTKPEFYLYPDVRGRLSVFFFLLNMLAAPLTPQVIQRAYIAASDDVLRYVCGAMLAAPFLAQTPGILIGLTKAAFDGGWPETVRMLPAFSAMSNELMKKGIGEYALAAIMTCSAMAAIMSTADSVLMGIAATVTIEIYKGFINPEASTKAMEYVGICTSVIMVCCSIFLGLGLSTDMFSSLLATQNGFTFQLVPVFALGLYFNISAKALTVGMASGLILSALLFVLDQAEVVDFGGVPWVNIAVLGNFVMVLLTQVLATDEACQSTPATAQAALDRFGPQLQLDKIKEFMAESREPPQALVGLMLLAIFASVPWYGSSGVETPPFALGVPRWGCVMIFASVAAMLLGFAIVAYWRPGGPGSGSGAEAPKLPITDLRGSEQKSCQAAEKYYGVVVPATVGKAAAPQTAPAASDRRALSPGGPAHADASSSGRIVRVFGGMHLCSCLGGFSGTR